MTMQTFPLPKTILIERESARPHVTEWIIPRDHLATRSRCRVERLVLSGEAFATGRIQGLTVCHQSFGQQILDLHDLAQARALYGEGERLVLPIGHEAVINSCFTLSLQVAADEVKEEVDPLRIASDLLAERGLALNEAQLRSLLAPTRWPLRVHALLEYTVREEQYQATTRTWEEQARERWPRPRPSPRPDVVPQEPDRNEPWSVPDAPPWLKPWGR
jgi:hypothetical protein